MLEKLKPLADKIAETGFYDKHRSQKRAEWFIAETNIKKYLKKGGQYLDIGTGRGHIVERILSDMEKNKKPLKSYACIDLSSKPARLVQKREGKRKHAEGNNPLNFSLASGAHLPFRDQAMDGVSITFALHHMPLEVIDDSINEAKRVIKKDGLIFITEDTVGSEEQREITLRADRLLNFEGIDEVHNYRSIEEWERYFDKRGLEVVDRRGFSSKLPAVGIVPHHFLVLKLKPG
jgi:ubiquinone/menaquinone biosynthesis C-methylase UbiE